MPTFASRSLSPSPLSSHLRRHPFLLFGLPFISLVIASSFALQTFTRIRYDLHDQKVTTLTKEEELGMSHKRKKVDLRDEYYVCPFILLLSLNMGKLRLNSTETDWDGRTDLGSGFECGFNLTE